LWLFHVLSSNSRTLGGMIATKLKVECVSKSSTRYPWVGESAF
jgi:hypothetical protein